MGSIGAIHRKHPFTFALPSRLELVRGSAPVTMDDLKTVNFDASCDGRDRNVIHRTLEWVFADDSNPLHRIEYSRDDYREQYSRPDYSKPDSPVVL